MAEKIIVTGINGFVGEHVAREFSNQGYDVVGIGHDDHAHEKVSELVDEYIQCDLLDSAQVTSLPIENASGIVHLAGLANVGESFDQPERYMTANGIMTHNLLAKALDSSLSGRVVVVSTGALYDPTQPLPLSEDSETASNSPYAVGKLMCEDVVKYYRTRGVDAVVARPFNHIGPGQAPGFLLPDLYEQISTTQDNTVHVGNLETKRDYTDVRDIAKAYAKLALAQSLDHDTYNICSSQSVSGKDILNTLLQVTGKTDVQINVDQSKIRPTDIADIRGDASRLSDELDWKPEIPLQQTIQDFVESKK